MFWLIVGLVLVYGICIFVIQPFNYWKKQNIPHRKPWPLLGNMGPFVFGIKSTQDFFKSIYDQFPRNRLMGMHVFSMPVYLIRDPDLIKQIAIKDFEHFPDHALFHAVEELDPIISRSLVSLSGQKWKEMRSTIGPFFTSSKMKFMFTLIAECTEEYINHLETLGSDNIELDLKNVFARFTSDVIATVGFGLSVNSLKEPNNVFYTKGQEFINVEGVKAVKLMTYVAFPTIAKLLNIRVLPKRFEEYYTGLIKESIELRENSGLVRPDMIHLFLEARKAALMSNNEDKKILRDLTDDSIVAQSLVFFTAGFANSANALNFMSYELALNPDVQKKLQNEIDETLEKCNGKVTYEELFKIKYLDMVVSETLRKWPPGAVLDRKCVKDYNISPQLPNEQEVFIKKGAVIFLPIAAIQHDPKYYPIPTKFDPERFNDQNKGSIAACSFISMGAGPRRCIASRLAYMEIKIMFFHLLSRFDIVPTRKTSIPILQNKLQLNLGSVNGFWLGLKKRSTVL